ncbi:hypothetical protein IAR55_001744 [Kwoniella newhampshirensis]|uniref:Zn(2)-C6 fungal-type domain-containing protein n=1 Tax=Kwoniella newhampshirensis TaxID=1651941 RepID=A0AAW0Z3A0_9TREE
MSGPSYSTASDSSNRRQIPSSDHGEMGSLRNRGGGDDREGPRNWAGHHTGVASSSENRIERNFPQNVQAPIPSPYHRYQPQPHSQQFSQQHHQQPATSGHMQPPPTTATPATVTTTSNVSHQTQRIDPEQSYSVYGGQVNPYRSSSQQQQQQHHYHPHGIPETVPSSASPVAPHRYDYAFSHGHPSPATVPALPPQEGDANVQGVGMYHNPRRRESMPAIIGASAFQQALPNRNPSSGSSSHYQGDYDPRFAQYIPPQSGSLLQQQQPSHQSQPLSPANAATLRGWQSMQNTAQSQQPQQLQTIQSHSAVPAAQPEQRSRGSTLGSRTTDDEMHGGTGTGTGTGTDEGKVSRQSTEEPARPREEEDRSLQSIASSHKNSNFKVKNEVDDDLMEIDNEGDGDEKMDHRKRKRNRTIRSCVPCHNHKRKCDRKRPCGRCTALGLTGTCVYEIDEARDLNDPDVAEADRLRRRIAELEQVVRELRQRTPTRGPNAGNVAIASTAQQTATVAVDDAVPDDGKKRRVIVDRFARFKLDEAKHAENSAAAAASGNGTPTWAPCKALSSKGSNDVDSRGSSGESTESGKAVAEASSSQSQPHVGAGRSGTTEDYRTEPYSSHLLPGEEMVADRSGTKTFLGDSAGKSMLRKLRELASSKSDSGLLTVAEDVAFTGVFPDMRKTFPFTTIWSHDNFSAEIIGLLPSQQQSELLWEAWFDDYAAHFAPFHMPTLEAEYLRFFAMSTPEKMNVPLSSLAVFLMVCALGCLMRATSSEIFGHPDREVAAQAKTQGTALKDPRDLTCSRLQSELYPYQALRLCSFLANPTVHTLQCQLLIEVYLLVSERAADAWSIGGSVIKQAIALGLHKDPLSLDPKVSMRDAEIKRRLWWSIAGFDCMLCIFFGRPSGINYYTTNLPQDRPDENLSDAPGSAQQYLPPSNVLSNKTTDQTYHAAYYQLTIPSFEILERIFHTDRKFSRSAIYGWFSPPPDQRPPGSSTAETNFNTYQDAIGLAKDISQWYSHLPDGMRFDVDDTPEVFMASRTRKQGNQALGLCVKTWTLVMVLHRPYLRMDPAAYPESTAICIQSAHMILRAYTSMVETKSTLAWSFWTMSYRAFQAGAVCAFLAIREPGTELAAKCLEDLRGAIAIFEDRLTSWITTHPVQADLCEGLLQLEKLVAAATEQRHSPYQPLNGAQSRHTGFTAGGDQTLFGLSPTISLENSQGLGGTPRSQIQGFPPMSPSIGGGLNMFPTGSFSSGDGDDARSLNNIHMGVGTGATSSGHESGSASSNMNDLLPFTTGSYPIIPAENLSGTFSGDFNGPEPLALPQFWASMFGIKLDKDPKDGPPSGVTWG